MTAIELSNHSKQPFLSFEDPILGILPTSFSYVMERLIKPANIVLENPVRELESAEYGAVTFNLNGKTVLYRQAKTTPKKIGQFVTIWKRETPDSEIAPFDITDGVDWVIVATDDGGSKFGIFVFNAQLLAKKDIFSEHGEGGKRAIRVYAPWTVPVATQAKRTKKWQTETFLDVSNIEVTVSKFAKLIG